MRACRMKEFSAGAFQRAVYPFTAIAGQEGIKRLRVEIVKRHPHAHSRPRGYFHTVR